ALPKLLGEAEVEQLLQQPDTATPRGLRDRALIEVLYATGMRVSEPIHLRASDLNLEAGYLSCTGKGNKQSIVPIGAEATKWLQQYIRTTRPALLGKPASPWLFESARRGWGLSAVGLWTTAKGY